MMHITRRFPGRFFAKRRWGPVLQGIALADGVRGAHHLANDVGRPRGYRPCARYGFRFNHADPDRSDGALFPDRGPSSREPAICAVPSRRGRRSMSSTSLSRHSAADPTVAPIRSPRSKNWRRMRSDGIGSHGRWSLRSPPGGSRETRRTRRAPRACGSGSIPKLACGGSGEY